MVVLKEQDKKWADETWEKIMAKYSKVVERCGNKVPYTSVDGVFDDKAQTNINWWTNGFWPGLLLILYDGTGEEKYLEVSRRVMDVMDGALMSHEKLHHDVGFMWNISSGADYRLTGNEKQRSRLLLAAALLMNRYNLKGEFIRAWHGKGTKGWAIIDCMMNLPLLYRVGQEIDDDRYKMIAMSHADTTMRYHVRPDGSCNHINEYDPMEGGFVRSHTGQGYPDNPDSSWSRGQAWGLYGFVLSYIHTGKQEYLDTAKQIAHYFIANLADSDWLPMCDFRAPEEPLYYDSTAGACAACGLIELANQVDEYEKKIYINAAIKILKAMTDKFCDFDADHDSLLLMGAESYQGDKCKPIIYGDFFYVEAVQKLRKDIDFSW